MTGSCNLEFPKLNQCKLFHHLTGEPELFGNLFSFLLRMSLYTPHIPNHPICNQSELRKQNACCKIIADVMFGIFFSENVSFSTILSKFLLTFTGFTRTPTVDAFFPLILYSIRTTSFASDFASVHDSNFRCG